MAGAPSAPGGAQRPGAARAVPSEHVRGAARSWLGPYVGKAARLERRVAGLRRREEREELDAFAIGDAARLQHAALSVPAHRREHARRGAHPAARQVVDQVRAEAGDLVRRAVDLELAPDVRNATGAVVAGLVRVAARLVPRPERRAHAELVLQVLVLDEVLVGGIGRAARVGAPLAREHRSAAEPARLVDRGL